MIQDGKQKGLEVEDLPIGRSKKPVESKYLQNYHDLMGSVSTTKDIQLILSEHQIIYSPESSFQDFAFEVQWMVPVPDYYKIDVKIAHFSFSITAVRQYVSNPFKEHYQQQGSFGKIYFVEFDNKSLCFKSFQFEREEEFQPLFQRVVKEYSILKICSALECAPYIENYFGFDIAIYDNCIQFATEQGRDMSYLIHRDKEQLKAQLALLHQLSIIHYDIKPENIVFSNKFQKPVFIDFGMSEIIEEQLGFKTLASFRGTPNYCTPQVLDLMVEQQGWADLYYNDLFCLSISAQEMKNHSEEEYRQSKSCIRSKKKTKKQQFLHLIAFCFYYLSKKEFQAKTSLEKYLYLGGNVRRVLEFIKIVIRYIFMPTVFDRYLLQYKDHILYQEIAEQRKIADQKIFFRSSSIENETTHNYRQFDPLSFNQGNQFEENPGTACKKDFINLYEVIMKITILEEKTVWNYFSIILSCLRFDRRNISVEQKYNLAKKVNPLISKYRRKEELLGEDQPGSIETKQIKKLFMAMLQFFLEVRPALWAKDNIIDIFQQLSMLDADLSPFIDSFLECFEFDISCPMESIMYVFQCQRVRNTMMLIYSDHMEKVEIVQGKIKQFLRRNFRKFEQQNLASNDYQILPIKKIIEILQINDACGYKMLIGNYEQQFLSCIKNTNIKKCVLFLLIQKSLGYWHSNSHSEKLLQNALHLKKYWQAHKIDFFCWMDITINIIKIASSDYQLILFFKEIQKIINCEEIMQNIRLNGQLASQSNETLFKLKIKKLLASYPKLKRMKQLGNFVLHDIISQTTAKPSILIDENTRKQLKLLYYCYQKSAAQIKISEMTTVFQFCKIYWNAEIMTYFYAFSPETQGALKMQLAQVQEDIKLFEGNTVTTVQEYLTYFRLYLYRFNFYKLKNNFQQCLENLFHFIELSEKLNLQVITLQAIKNINQLIREEGADDLIVGCTNKLYQYCLKAKCISLYLFPSNVSHTFTTLVVFATLNNDLFYQFLQRLVNFLYMNPIDSYISTLLESLEKFQQKDPKHAFLIHYSVFQKKFRSNPYYLIFYMYSLKDQKDHQTKLKLMKAIAAHVDKLSQFAKGRILERYFAILLCFIRQKAFQQRLFTFHRAKVYLRENRILHEAKHFFRKAKKIENVARSGHYIQDKINQLMNNVCDKSS